MASNLSKADALTPIITFVSVVVIGIIISQYVIEDESLVLPIILGSFAIGILVTALELRAMIGRKRIEAKVERASKMTHEERQNKLARYVADLFDEDIPFDEIEAEKQRKLDEMKEKTGNSEPEADPEVMTNSD